MRAMIGWMTTPLRLALAVAALLVCIAGAAQAANPLEKNFYLNGPRYDGNLPQCESALMEIRYSFAQKERNFWNSGLQIMAYGRVWETGFRPWESDNIPRRFCSAEAMLNDGKERIVHFSIIEDGGLASFTNGVEFCVVGLDRNWAFNPACRAARP